MAKKATKQPKVTDAVFEEVNEIEIQTSNVAEKVVSQVTTDIESVVDIEARKTTDVQVKPIEWETYVPSLSEEDKEAVIALSDQIDVLQIEKIMSYGSVPFKNTFEQCGTYLKKERGSSADQAVIKEVVELSKKAANSHDDFELALKEPNVFQKIWLKLSTRARESRTEKIQKSAISSFNLVGELKESAEAWVDILKESMGDISQSTLSDQANVRLLEMYIAAAKRAVPRIEAEIKAKKQEYEAGGSVEVWQQHEDMKDGKEIFDVTLANLEKTRMAYYLSLAELNISRRSNRNMQITIKTQAEQTLAIFVQQLRNAVINQKTIEVAEGQKSMVRLNDEVIMAVAKKIGKTGEETEAMLYQGVYHTAAAENAVKEIIASCKQIKGTSDKLLPQMEKEVERINALMEELKPAVASINRAENTPKIESSNDTTSAASANESGKLQF